MDPLLGLGRAKMSTLEAYGILEDGHYHLTKSLNRR